MHCVCCVAEASAEKVSVEMESSGLPHTQLNSAPHDMTATKAGANDPPSAREQDSVEGGGAGTRLKAAEEGVDGVGDKMEETVKSATASSVDTEDTAEAMEVSCLAPLVSHVEVIVCCVYIGHCCGEAEH